MTALQARRVDVLLALSLVGWAVAGVWAAPQAALPVVLATATLHGTVALLLTLRDPVRRRAGARQLAGALPSFGVCLLAVGLAPAPASWPPAVLALFVGGALLAATALARLGRNFAILPALRGIVTHGPYARVRHPAYLGELLMLAACALAIGGLAGAGVALLAVAAFVLRIHAEEALLATDAGWRRYAATVRARLIPGLW